MRMCVRLINSWEHYGGGGREVSGFSIKPPMSTRPPRSSRGQPEPDEDNMELADAETYKARQWDEFKEANPKYVLFSYEFLDMAQC